MIRGLLLLGALLPAALPAPCAGRREKESYCTFYLGIEFIGRASRGVNGKA